MARKQQTATANQPETSPNTMQLRTESRLFRIARALASGATVTEIAKTENIGRTSASKVANSQACRQLLMQFVNDECESMFALFYRALRVIEHGFSARREYLLKDGTTSVGGPTTMLDFQRSNIIESFCLPVDRPRRKKIKARNASRSRNSKKS